MMNRFAVSLRVLTVSAFLLLGCLSLLGAMARPAGADVFTNVPEAAGYTLVYTLPIPANANFNSTAIPYTVNNSATAPANFDRVAYYLELQPNGGGPLQYVYVSFDRLGGMTAANKIGVPNVASGEFYQQFLSNMNVVSNVAGIVTGTGIQTGNIEFWPSNYAPGNGTGVPNANGGTFDFGDDSANGAAGYGSMQIHNYGASQTLFGYNAWGNGAGDLGIGNQGGGNPDWTFATNVPAYTVCNLQILVNSSGTAQTGPNFVVNVTNDNDGVCTVADCSLREAIIMANSNADASTITFDAAVFNSAQTISLDSALPSVETNITMSGPTTGQLTVRPTVARAFTTLAVGGGTLNVSNLHLSHGDADLVNFSTVVVMNCTLSDAQYGLLNFASAVMVNSTASGNDLGQFNYGPTTQATLTNCTYSGNSHGLFSDGTATLTNCTLSGNTGYGLYNYGTSTLRNNLIVGNVANVSIERGSVSQGPDSITSGTAAAAGLDPLGLQPNGGPTATIALTTRGTAVNAGSNALAVDASSAALITDQRGSGFARIVGGTVDIGAYEVQNTAPVASDQSVTTDEETVVAITLGAADVDGDTLSYILTQLPAHGTLTNADNSAIVNNTPSSNIVKYTPELNYPLGAPPATGPDSFKFKANDGTIDSNVATVSITVNAICDFPLSVGDSYATGENTTLTVTAPGVLGNDSEFDGETLHAIKVTNPAHGTLTLNDNGSFVYAPALNYSGPDSFTYKVTDGGLDGNTVTVNITVTAGPAIGSFTPISGAPGTGVTVNGSRFIPASVVKLNGVVVGAADIVSITATKIVFKIPANGTSGRIGVSNAGGEHFSTGTFTVMPRSLTFAPSSGAPSTIVVISGVNFGNGCTVRIGGVVAPVQSFSATELRVSVATTTVTGLITVTNNGGTATSATNFTVLPKVTSFTPAGAAEGAAVTINGSGFTGATAVQFNGTAVSSFVVVSNTKITTTVPVNATAGKIAVVTPVGTALSANSFRLAPTVTNVTPTSGQKQSRVTITGKNLETATVKIGAVAQIIVTAADRTATSITFTVPNATVSGPIIVTNAGGSTTAGTFTVLP